MSQIKQKVKEFAVQIRRKNLKERMSAIRAQIFEENNQIFNSQQLQKLLGEVNDKNIGEHLAKLKMLSWIPQAAKQLLPIINIICKSIAYSADKQFEDGISILINISVISPIYVSKQFLLSLAKMILKPQRQDLVFWLFSNLLYRKNDQNQMIISFLVDIQTTKYLITRKIPSLPRSSLIITNFFACALLACGGLLPFEDYKRVLSVLKKIQQLQLEQTDWYLSQAFLDHSSQFSVHDFQIFVSQLFPKFKDYCRLKKTKLIKNYLQAIKGFLEQDPHKQNYQKILKYGIFQSLVYCLQNRSPQIKKVLCEIGRVLLQQFSDEIDNHCMDFFVSLAKELNNILKYQEDVQISMLKYIQQIIYFALNKRAKDQVCNIVEQTQLISSFSSILSSQKELVISVCVNILIKIVNVNQTIKKKCQFYGIRSTLEGIDVNNTQLAEKIQQLIQEFEQLG